MSPPGRGISRPVAHPYRQPRLPATLFPGYYADILEVTDAEAGEGLDGHVRVIETSVALYGGLRRTVERFRSALAARGQTYADLRRIEDRADRRREMWNALYDYTGGDHEGDVLLRTDKSHRVRHGAQTVNGTPGLRRYLRQHHALHFTRGGQPK